MIENSQSNGSLEKRKPFSDSIALFAWVLLNGYNLLNTSYNSGGLTLKYFFQLTHITSFFIGAIFFISLVHKCRKHTEVDSSHFSNMISFTLGLSIVTDVMFWLFVYHPTTSILKLTDVVLMHGVITVVLIAWMISKSQIPFCKGYQRFKTNDICEKIKAVAWVLAPIALITVTYMGWTYLGQLSCGQPIYQNVIDWNHTGLTFTTFERAAAGFLVITALYWFFTWMFFRLCPCAKTNQHVFSENNIE